MRHLTLLLITVGALSACDDASDPAGPPVDEAPPVVTVDATEDWSFLRLGDEAEEVAVSTPAASDAWDIGFFATAVMLNGGDAGPAGVEGYCVCQNAGASDEAVRTFTDAEGLAHFEAVTAADVPAAEDAWQGDGLAPAIEGWWSYDPVVHVMSAVPTAVWKVRLADGVGFAKLHVIELDGPTQEHAGRVTLEFAVQPAAAEPFGPVQRLTVDVADGPVRVDLRAATVTDAAWDLALEGHAIRVNGGVSGDGQAGALPVEEAFDAITDASDLSSTLYAADAYGGVFTSDEPGAGWYRYNLEGAHQIWPTYNVYLVRRGDDIYKVQLVGYYNATGDSRHVTVRYERLEE